MVVVTRKRRERVRAVLDGRELIVIVTSIGTNYVRLGFEGPHRIQRFEIEQTPRRPRSHLAGMPIAIGAYHVQRCTLCGEVLQEFDLQELKPGSCAPAGLAAGRFYECRSERDFVLSPIVGSLRFESHSELPSNCCIFGG